MLRLAPDHYAIRIDHLTVGKILCTRHRGATRWLWTITGPHCASAGVAGSGEAPDLKAARLALRTSFQCWLTWALEQEGPVAWKL